MKNQIYKILGGAAFALLPFWLSAASSDVATVNFSVGSIKEISVSGNPSSLDITTATAGSNPDDATDATTTYAITTNLSTQKITGAIDTAMPSGVTLKVNLAAPTGATSAGTVTLSTTASDLVTGISQVAESGKTITYTLSATPAAGQVASTNRTITLTVTA